MKRRLLTLVLICLLCACSAPPRADRTRLSAVEAVNAEDNEQFAKATAPRPFVFPRDHGSHDEYQTEWWYYTGNLQSADGRTFGFQLTFFRRALLAEAPQRPSDLATRSIYMAHLAISDISQNAFYSFERFSRDGGDWAGASGEPFQAWLDDWRATGSGPEGMQMELQASQDDIGLALRLENSKPALLQGDRGLSQKGEALGNASYYYSLTRMLASGTLTINGQSIEVTGLAWMDHEFGTSALDRFATGWDWFSLQFDDGRELVFFHIRQADGSISRFSGGHLVEADGSARRLERDELELSVLTEWQSPHTQIRYPARWRLSVPSAAIDIDITPAMADQELLLTVTYWEGAVRISGSASGRGYVELTGY